VLPGPFCAGRSRSAAFFPGRLFQYPQGFVEPLEEFRHILLKEKDRLTLEAACFPVIALHDVEIKVPHTVLLYIEEISPVLELNPG
jgi:hypothetical protein